MKALLPILFVLFTWSVSTADDRPPSVKDEKTGFELSAGEDGKTLSAVGAGKMLIWQASLSKGWKPVKGEPIARRLAVDGRFLTVTNASGDTLLVDIHTGKFVATNEVAARLRKELAEKEAAEKEAAAKLEQIKKRGEADVRIWLYIHCDKRNDNPWEQTDEVYVISDFAAPGGKPEYRPKVGSHDYRDGGGRERSGQYPLASAKLVGADYLVGEVMIMEEDDNLFAIIRQVLKAHDDFVKSIVPGDFKLVPVITGKLHDLQLGSLAKLTGKGHDHLGMFIITVGQNGGKPVLDIQAKGKGMTKEKMELIEGVDGTKFEAHSFRLRDSGANYHAMIWIGPPRKGHPVKE
jgi:hypothetical protein